METIFAKDVVATKDITDKVAVKNTTYVEQNPLKNHIFSIKSSTTTT